MNKKNQNSKSNRQEKDTKSTTSQNEEYGKDLGPSSKTKRRKTSKRK